ncbi:fibronectin type III domain-containing protein [Paenibacillus contaminans]|uniref:Fibronectin type-III domain-containing protein n=1 Tax=Paenibacillus contaminans TaxID=450362 RepID=A0A329LXJ6_9BACL|nr:fibronectin type III domain-containing protein [Paenibacillus contaminans]RAV12168.1 hypothetical protein DQG23_35190 [Paenibacillus contaminans]
MTIRFGASSNSSSITFRTYSDSGEVHFSKFFYKVTTASNYFPGPTGNTGTESTATLNGLPPNTEFDIKAEIYRNGSFSGVATNSIKTDPVSSTPSPPSNYNITVSGLNVKVNFTKGSGADTTEIDYWWNGQGNVDSSTSEASLSFSVPSYNTTYQFDMRSRNSSGTSGWVIGSFTTGSAPSATLNIASVGDRGFEWQISNLQYPWNSQYYKKVAIASNPVSNGQTQDPNVWSTQWPSTGGSANQTPWDSTIWGYGDANTVYGIAKVEDGSGGAWYNAGTAFVRLKPAPLSGLSVSKTGDGFVRLSWNGANGAASYFISWSPSHNGGSATVYSNSADITGLQNGTTYTFTVTPRNATGDGVSSSRNGMPLNRPLDFQWDSPKVSGQPFHITASEWNRLTNKINEFRRYKQVTNPDYPFTSATSGNVFEVYYYRQAVEAISAMSSNVPPLRNSGDIIYASDIDRLRTAINDIQ